MKSTRKNTPAKTKSSSKSGKKTNVSAAKSKGPRAKRESRTASRRGLNETPDTTSLEDYEEIGTAYDENEVASEANDIEDIDERDNDDDEWTDTLYPSEDEINAEWGEPDKILPDQENDNTKPGKKPKVN